MSPPVKPESVLSDDDRARIMGNIDKLRAAKAPDADIDRYLQEVEHLSPAGAAPPHPKLGNAAGMLSGAAQGATFGFADEALGGIDALNSILPKSLGGGGAPVSKMGEKYRETRDMIRASNNEYANENPLKYGGAAVAGGLATSLAGGGANLIKAAPTATGKLLAALDQGVVAGATSGLGSAEGSPGQQADAAVRGGMVGGPLALATTGLGMGIPAAGRLALNKANLRPEEPLMIGGIRMPIKTVDEEAARKVAEAFAKSGKPLPPALKRLAEAASPFASSKAPDDAFGPLDPSVSKIGPPTGLTPPRAAPSDMEIPTGINAGKGKPQTLMELGGQPVARLARTARSASPQAGAKIDETLAQRTAGAPDRAIQDALEVSGLQKRTSAFQTTKQLIAERSAEAEKNYAPVFKDQTPISDPRIDDLLETPAGQQAWKRAQRMMANDRVKVPTVNTEPPPPAGISPDSWSNMLRLAKERGIPLPSGEAKQAPTIQQLHYLKLALDDLKQPGLDRGEGGGGLGYNEGRSVHGVQKDLLAVMDEKSPAYAQARQQYAGQSALKNANEIGSKLFSMKPEEAADEYANLGSAAEKQVFRRAGMDALADRLENGPADVEKGVSKPRDLRRIRLLFPDNASFQQFKDRIAKEAEMIDTHRFVSGGSQTADKLSDLSDMLGLSTVAKAATGNLSGAAKDVAGGLLKLRGQSYGSRLGNSIADLTTAGGNGNQNELQQAIEQLRAIATGAKPQRGPTGSRALAAAAGLYRDDQ